MQRDLFEDANLAGLAAEIGMAQALHADRITLWKRQADSWLLWRQAGTTFVADDLVRHVGLPDQGVARNNVVGAWISAQSRKGRIRFTGRFQKSERVIGHGNLQRVWEVTP